MSSTKNIVTAEVCGFVDLCDATARIRGYAVPWLARTELYVVFTLAEDTITLDIECSTDLFDESTISAWHTDIVRTIENELAAMA